MASTSAKDKFDAAVKVIRGLPANGPFQPSYDLMLKFYSYYKQATEGKCTLPKPSFWDVVNKKKWEAWNKLGDMEREKAMTLYVDELKKVSNHVKETYYPPQIVETMPQTEEVSVFLQKLDTFYEMVEETGQGKEDNNNALAVNGDIKSVTNGDGTPGQEALNHSDNVTLLLKQDMKKVQESAGIVMPSDDRCTNGHGSYNGNDSKGLPDINGRYRGKDDESDVEEDDDDEEEEDDESDEEEEEVEEEYVRVERTHGLLSSRKNESLSNGGKEWSESETENEEFCDTSDEPVTSNLTESSLSQSQLTQSTTQPFPTKFNGPAQMPLNSSTPVSNTKQSTHHSKSVRVNGILPSSSSSSLSNHHHLHNNNSHHLHQLQNRTGARLLSDSLEVQTSRIAEHEREKEIESVIIPGFASPSSGSFLSASQDSVSSSSRDYSSSQGGKVEGGNGGLVGAEVNCRGGDREEEARDRRRKGGSQSSKAVGGSSRDALKREGSSGAGSGGSEGGARLPHPSRGGGGGSRDPAGGEDIRSDLNEQIVVTLLRLQRDMSGVLNRLHSLEALVKEGRREQEERKLKAKKSAWWWPFPDLSVQSASLIFLWPIVLHIVLAYMSRRRNRLRK